MEIFIFIRVLSFFAVTNLIYPLGTPKTFKVIMSFSVSVIISFTLRTDQTLNITNTVIFFMYIINETIIGIVLGYITNITFYVIKFAGSLIDQQMGLGMASVFDPNTQSQSTIIENIMYWFAVMIFFNLDGHHMLIEVISYTFKIIPVGESILKYDIMYIVKIFTEAFEIGFKIAIPVILCLFISEMIMGIISRSVPQLNIMIVGVPVKILLGLMIFSIAIPIISNEIIQLIKEIPNMYESTIGAMPICFMLSNDKTEEATPKKKSEQRKKGNIARSKEISLATTLLVVTMLIPSLFQRGLNEVEKLIRYFLTLNLGEQLTMNNVESLMLYASKSFLFIFLPVGLVILLVGVLSNLSQVGILFTGEGLKPSFSKLNPINGFKNMFSAKNLMTLFKDLGIICILGYIGFSFFKDNYMKILNIGNLYTPTIIFTVKDIIFEILKKMCLVIVVIAICDYAFQKYNHKKGMRMTKQEVKDEYKQAEGDPQVKSKIKQKQREIASRRMMQEVPNAAVIINNPTHISVAIKYEGGKNQVPVVIAKGADHIAFKIREIAKANEIPMIENKPLARMIYRKVELNEEIPEEMYQAVAEILVAVYKIKNKRKYT